jgi:hypothetical protein
MNVLSEQSKHNLEQTFHQAVRANFVRNAEDALDVATLPHATAAEHLDGELLLITISSFAFRLLFFLRIDESPVARAYYLDAGAESGLAEVFAELANLCCGAVNRELSRSFPHLGMSIPYQLNQQCGNFLPELKPEHLTHYMIRINDVLQLHATLCVCCTVPVEFAPPEAKSETHGEALELF